MNCKNCGGPCNEIGGGKYECQFCGAVFSAEVPRARATESVVRGDAGVDVFEKNIGGIFETCWTEGRIDHLGSGFVITDGGYAITNAHVVSYKDGRSCGKISVKLKDEEISASVVALGDDKHGMGNGIDLAIVKLSRIPFGMKVLKFANFADVRIGETVFVIGNSLGYGTCITRGIVSDKLRNVDGKMLLMYDCATNPGNSGGPVFNAKGEVIGVHVQGEPLGGGVKAQGMNYAIPANDAIAFLRKHNIRV